MPTIKVCLNCRETFEITCSRSRAERIRFCSLHCRVNLSLAKRLEIVGYNVSASGCWIWRGYTDADGYGRIHPPSGNMFVHRASWQIHRGPIPSGLNVLHSCDVPPCFNPCHLFLGSDADNTADMMAKGRNRQLRGEESARSILTEDQVRDILSRPRIHGSGLELAEEFGVSPSAITDIRTGRTWTHVG